MVSKLKGTASPRDSKTCEDGPGVKIEALATCRFESFQRYSKITVNYMYTYIYIIYIYIIFYIYIIYIIIYIYIILYIYYYIYIMYIIYIHARNFFLEH